MSNWKHKILQFGKYTWSEITAMVEDGYIPVANATELDGIRNTTPKTMGVGSIWEDEYVTGLDKKYVQINNIDLAFVEWSPIGSRNNFFTGIYNGNRLRIDKCKVVGNIEDSGLFGGCNGSIVRNCVFVDFDIYSNRNSNVNGVIAFSGSGNLFENLITFRGSLHSFYARSGNGGMFGLLQNDNVVINCHTVDTEVYTEVSLTNVINYTGGLIGIINNNNIISKCSTSGTVRSDFDVASVSGCGGFMGNTATTGRNYINDCISYANVIGYQRTAGFIGYNRNSSVFTNCASVGQVIGQSGFCNINNGVISNCYYDKETSDKSDTGKGKGLPRTTAQMKEGTADSTIGGEAMYTNWDNTIWNFRTINKYPKIRKI